jgi:hypothetical protein
VSEATLTFTTKDGAFVAYTLSEWTLEQSYPARVDAWMIGEEPPLPSIALDGKVSSFYVVIPSPTLRQRLYKLLMRWKTNMLERAI